jgi:hypothetical protein
MLVHTASVRIGGLDIMAARPNRSAAMMSSFDAAFLFLAAIAATGSGILYFLMPETREKHFLNEHL